MNAKLKKRKAAKVGRKPARNVQRYPGGQVKHSQRRPVETQDEVLAVVMAQPHRRGASDPRSPFLGYSVGRLLASGQISRQQHDAAEWFGKLWLSYHRQITGVTPPRVSAHLQEFIAASHFRLSHVNDNTDWAAIDRLRDRMDRLQLALADAGQYVSGNELLPRVCVFDMDCPPGAIGALREALNTVCRCMQKGA